MGERSIGEIRVEKTPESDMGNSLSKQLDKYKQLREQGQKTRDITEQSESQKKPLKKGSTFEIKA